MNADMIRYLRYVNRLTQKEFAERIGVSEPLIVRIELGIRGISDKTKQKIREAFGLAEADIMRLRELDGNGAKRKQTYDYNIFYGHCVTANLSGE
jgi:transcriptional regulator with XRE-family HTH domain